MDWPSQAAVGSSFAAAAATVGSITLPSGIVVPMPSEPQCTADRTDYHRLEEGLPSSFGVPSTAIEHQPSSSFTTATYQPEKSRTSEGPGVTA